MQVGETFIKVRPDTRGFAGELQGDVQQAGQGIGSEVGGAISRQLGAVLAGGAAVSFLRDSVSAASDLNEAVSLTEVSFQGAADGVLEMGENSAESFGLANDEALSFANSIGGLFIGFGETRAEAAAMAEDVVGLGADLASAKNLTGGTAEALEILRSGLVGETEPLRRIGVAINAANVEQRALADTGKDSAAALTEGEKAAARYALIFESLNRQGVVGDFARTAGGAANQQRILAAEFRNAQADLGQQLLPAFIDLIGAARDSIPLLSIVGSSLSSSAEGASLLAGAIAPLVGVLNGANGAIEDFTGGVLDMTSVVPGQIGQIVAIVDAAKAAFRGGIEIGPVTFGGGGEEGDVGERFGSTADEIEDAMDRLGLSFGGDNRIAPQEWASAVQDYAVEAGISFADALDELNIRGNLATGILDVLASGTSAAGEAAGSMAAELLAVQEAASRTDLDASAEAMTAVADAASDARDQLDALFGVQQSVAEGAINIRDRARDLLAQFVELGEGGYRSQTEAGDAFLSGLQEQQTAIIDQTLAVAATTGSYDQARAAQHRMEEGLYNLARAAGVPDSELAALRATFGTLPRRTLLEVAQQGAQEVQGQITTTKRLAEGYASKNYRGTLSLDDSSARATLVSLTQAITGRTYTIPVAIAAPSLLPGESAAVPGESARAPEIHFHVGTVVGDPSEFARAITPAVAAGVDEMMRRS